MPASKRDPLRGLLADALGAVAGLSAREARAAVELVEVVGEGVKHGVRALGKRRGKRRALGPRARVEVVGLVEPVRARVEVAAVQVEGVEGVEVVEAEVIDPGPAPAPAPRRP